MAKSAETLKVVLGVLLILAGTMTLTGADRTLQTTLESVMPKSILALTTRL